MAMGNSDGGTSRAVGFVVLVILAIVVVLGVAWYFTHSRPSKLIAVADKVAAANSVPPSAAPSDGHADAAPAAAAPDAAAPMPLPPLPPVPKTIKIGGPSDEELYGGELAPGEVGADGRGGRYARETATFGQVEQRDPSGRITQEAVLVHAVTCPGGRRIQVYQFANRPGFRAILPLDAGRALGGHDFPQYEQAVRAGCMR